MRLSTPVSTVGCTKLPLATRAGSPAGAAAGRHHGAFAAADLDVAGDLLPMLARDHRAYVGVRVARVAHDQARGALGELAGEAVVDRALHEDARAGGAAFAVDREDGEQRRVQRALLVGVLEHQHGRLAAQLHRQPLDAGALGDALAGGGAAGEGNGAHVGMAHQRVAGFRAMAVHDVEHALGHAGLQRQPAEPVGGHGRQLRHLQHRVLPSARQGATFQVAVISGTFQGEISPHTPTGCSSV